jgi:hypothetical protein
LSGDFGEIGDVGRADDADAGNGDEVELKPLNLNGVTVLAAVDKFACESDGFTPWNVKLVEPNDDDLVSAAFASAGVLELARKVGKGSAGLAAGVDIDAGAVCVSDGKRLVAVDEAVVGADVFGVPKTNAGFVLAAVDVVAEVVCGILKLPNVTCCFGTKPPTGVLLAWPAGVVLVAVVDTAEVAAAAAVDEVGVDEKLIPPKLKGLLPTEPNENPPVALILKPESAAEVVTAPLDVVDGVAPGRSVSHDKQADLSAGFRT